LGQSRNRRNRFANAAGFTLIELLMVVSIIAAIAAIAVPGMMRTRMSANEASAIASLRAVSAAQAAYAGSTGDGGYAGLLATLGTPCPGSTTTFLSADLMNDPTSKSGYLVTLQHGASSHVGRVDCNGTPTGSTFYASAAPLSAGLSGNRGFATTNNGAMYFAADGTPPTEAQIAAGTATTLQ
jgi:type IV pilus assembly protein PilA